MDYQWSPSYTPDIDPNIVGHICEDLGELRSITAENLVWVSKNPSSQLHRLFLWDDTEAGHKYRLSQAGRLLASLKQKLPVPADPDKRKRNPDPLTVRAFYTYPHNDCHYETAQQILQDRHKYLRLMKKALRDLECFSTRYGILQEIAPILKQTDKLALQLRKIVEDEMDKLQAEDEAARKRNLALGRQLRHQSASAATLDA